MRPGFVPAVWLRGAPPEESNNNGLLEESRQHYANVRIQEFINWHRSNGWELPFSEVLRAFREFGLQYDQGNRLHTVAEGVKS